MLFQNNFGRTAIKNNIVKLFLDLKKCVKFLHSCNYFPYNDLLRLLFLDEVMLYFEIC